MHRRMKAGLALAAIVLVSWLGSDRVRGQQDQHAGHGMTKLGKVHFENSCSASVGQEFDRAMALLHSFEFPEAIAAFQAVLKARSVLRDRGMGHRDGRLGQSVRVGARGRRACFSEGSAAVERAQAIGAKTERERAYIDAVALLYDGADAGPARRGRSPTRRRWRRIYKQVSRTTSRRRCSTRCRRSDGAADRQDVRRTS